MSFFRSFLHLKWMTPLRSYCVINPLYLVNCEGQVLPLLTVLCSSRVHFQVEGRDTLHSFTIVCMTQIVFTKA